MTNNCGLNTTPASASIHLAGMVIKTPDIISISVSRTRGQIVGGASVSFHLTDANAQYLSTGSNIVIKIYTQPVFTGTIKRLIIQPSSRCSGELIIRIQAEDAMSKLNNKAFTRRQKLAGLGIMVLISSVVHRTYTGWDSPQMLHNISNSNSPIDIISHTINARDQTQFVNDGQMSVIGNLHPIMKVSDPITNAGGKAGTGGFILHDHSTLDISGPRAGGPSVGVFGIK